MSKPFLPYGRQSIDADDLAAVRDALTSEFLTSGPLVPRFEAEFAKVSGARHAIACSNGTAALHLAALAAGLGPGDRAVVPSITFVATANAVRMTGAEVVFADVDAETGLMSGATFEAARARAGGTVKAVLPVHLAGQCVEMAALVEAARRAGAVIIEDASHAVGAAADTAAGSELVGACSHGGYATFSLHPVKTITTGEGGVVTTADDDAARRLALLRNHGMSRAPEEFTERDLAFDASGAPNPWYYEMQDVGWNYRLTDIQAALGLSQIAKLSRFLARRSSLRARYARELASLAPLVSLSPTTPGSTPAWHLAVALIDFTGSRQTRAAVMRKLAEAGIGTQVHYIPVHRQPYYRRRYGAIDLPGAEAWYAGCLSLPLFPAMGDDDVTRVVETLGAVLKSVSH